MVESELLVSTGALLLQAIIDMERRLMIKIFFMIGKDK
jgi:hypothetical protein